MRAIAIALFTLLLGAGMSSAGAQAATMEGHSADPTFAANGTASRGIQLAAGAKSGDKYMSGRAGGRYGIGGHESVTKKKKK
jgi:hypothetical protein